MKHGRKRHPRMANPSKRSTGTIPFIGASTIWLGQSTSLLLAALASSERKNRNLSIAATAAAATINPHYAALLATLGKLEQEDE